MNRNLWSRFCVFRQGSTITLHYILFSVCICIFCYCYYSLQSYTQASSTKKQIKHRLVKITESCPQSEVRIPPFPILIY